MEYDNYMVTCDICGCEFDIENSGCCDCGFGCGGGQVNPYFRRWFGSTCLPGCKTWYG